MRRIHYPNRTMWNVEDRFSPKAIESLAALGFAVGSTRGVVRVEKYGSGAEFRKGTDGLYQMTILPTIMLKGQFTRLWDAGYQKFLLTDDGAKAACPRTTLAESAKVQRGATHRARCANFLQRGAGLGEPSHRLRSRQRPQGRRPGRDRWRTQPRWQSLVAAARDFVAASRTLFVAIRSVQPPPPKDLLNDG